MPVPGGTTTPMPGSYPMPVPGGTTIPMTGSYPMPIPGGTTYPMPGAIPTTGVATTYPMPIPGGTTYPMPIPGGTTYPMPIPGGAILPGTNGGIANAPKTALDMAYEAFRKGHDSQGFEFLYASAIVSEEAKKTLPDDFKWIPALKRPTLGVRWGLGVVYSPPRGYKGHPSPVGYTAPETTNNGIRGASTTTGNDKPRRSKVFGAPRDNQNQSGGTTSTTQTNKAPPESHPPTDPAEFISYYTGEVGERVVEILMERATEGQYGAVLSRAIESYDAAPSTTNNGYNPNTAMMPAMMPGTTSGQQKPHEEFKIAAIAPGVVVLGEGTENDLVAQAAEQQVDFIVLFEVSVRAAGKNITNNSKFHVMSVEQAQLPKAVASEGDKSRQLFSSKLINNQRVESARDDKKEDPLETEIASFVTALDAGVAIESFSEKVSSPEVAEKRVNFLASKETAHPLATLAELRFYEASKLVNKQTLAAALESVLGPADAKKLILAKTEEERLAAISKLLPKEAKAAK